MKVLNPKTCRKMSALFKQYMVGRINLSRFKKFFYPFVFKIEIRLAFCRFKLWFVRFVTHIRINHSVTETARKRALGRATHKRQSLNHRIRLPDFSVDKSANVRKS